jgi:hypothetical protein
MDKKFYLILLTMLSVAAAVFAAGCSSNPNQDQALPNASANNDSGQQAVANSSSPGTMFGNHSLANDIGETNGTLNRF